MVEDYQPKYTPKKRQYSEKPPPEEEDYQMSFRESKQLRNSQPMQIKLKEKSHITKTLDKIKSENDGKLPTNFQAQLKKKKAIKENFSK